MSKNTKHACKHLEWLKRFLFILAHTFLATLVNFLEYGAFSSVGKYYRANKQYNNNQLPFHHWYIFAAKQITIFDTMELTLGLVWHIPWIFYRPIDIQIQHRHT